MHPFCTLAHQHPKPCRPKLPQSWDHHGDLSQFCHLRRILDFQSQSQPRLWPHLPFQPKPIRNLKRKILPREMTGTLRRQSYGPMTKEMNGTLKRPPQSLDLAKHEETPMVFPYWGFSPKNNATNNDGLPYFKEPGTSADRSLGNFPIRIIFLIKYLLTHSLTHSPHTHTHTACVCVCV